MESVYTELAHYGSTHECARTDNAFLPISEVCNGTVSLKNRDRQTGHFQTIKVIKVIVLTLVA